MCQQSGQICSTQEKHCLQKQYVTDEKKPYENPYEKKSFAKPISKKQI